MLTPRLAKYAETTAKQCGADSGEILLLIFFGADVPDDMREGAEAFRRAVRGKDEKL